MTEVVFALLAISMVLTVVSVLVPLSERLRLPHTVLLALAGLLLGFASLWVAKHGRHMGAFHDAFSGLARLERGTDLFLPLFLPPLLFTAGLTIDVRRLLDEISAVLLMAVVAVLVCIAGVAGAVHLATGLDILVCLMLGAIVSTTDPASVIGVFRDVGAPKRLSILIEGESLFNDAVAIASFVFVVDVLVGGTASELSGWAAVLHVVRDFLGGIVFGFVIARLAMLVLPRLGDSDVAIASVTVSLAYLSYVLADHYLGVSGVISVVVAALTVAAYGPTNLHPRQWESLRQIWRQLDFWSNCLIFVLASMVAANVLPQMSWLYVVGLAAVALGAMVARASVVFGMLPLLEYMKLVEPVDRRYKVIMVWGGLRGAVTIVLAMVAAGNTGLPQEGRDITAVLATLFVLFTLFVNAATLSVVLHVLGLDRLSPIELALRDRVLALSRVNVAKQVQQVIREHNTLIEGLDVDPASAGEPRIEAEPPDLALGMEQRLTVGLLTLCTQERELYLGLFEQQTLSRRMVALLASRVERLTDAVRDRGLPGYAETARDYALSDKRFRVALWLQRVFGYEWLLRERLADRFEVLMVSQEVLAEVVVFVTTSIADLLGAEAQARLGEVIKERQDLVSRSLKALSLQYPGYAESIKDRQIERAEIRFESAEYTRRLRESVINREVYTDLRRELNKRRRKVSNRPPLDLGLELAAMIARVPLFASLDQVGVREVAKRLRARVALPGQKIITVGQPADSMYFIAAGEVKVHVGGSIVVLKEGDFFGEMGLLDSKPRNADVITAGYCHLLVLSRKEFTQLLAARPDIRTEIEAVAAQRSASPPANAWDEVVPARSASSGR